MSRLESWQSQVVLCQVIAKLSAEFWSSVGGRVGSPTLAGNIWLANDNKKFGIIEV